MADGLNQTRAFRIAEIMSDFRRILTFIAQIRANPAPEDYNEMGYLMLRRCVAEGAQLLNQPFEATQVAAAGDDEQGRAHLRRIITDAAYRRFKAQKIYLSALAALRWINARNALLQGHRPLPQHRPALLQIDANFRRELTANTDQVVLDSLRTADGAQGMWLDEDPSLSILQRMAAANGFFNAGNGGNGNGSGNGRNH